MLIAKYFFLKDGHKIEAIGNEYLPDKSKEACARIMLLCNQHGLNQNISVYDHSDSYIKENFKSSKGTEPTIVMAYDGYPKSADAFWQWTRMHQRMLNNPNTKVICSTSLKHKTFLKILPSTMDSEWIHMNVPGCKFGAPESQTIHMYIRRTELLEPIS